MSETKKSRDLHRTLCRRPDAQAAIQGSERFPGLSGLVRFYQTRRGVLIYAEVSGLPESAEACQNRFFAFHIHSGGQCTGNNEDPFADAMALYNPGGCPHPAHAGDLPPLLANHGYALQVFLTDRFTVSEIIGRTAIVHAGPDDFTTQPAGSAGSKIACGQIQALGPR